ncbi:MAG: hypothetical protein ACPKQO_11240 [Nitrososphaeraceae archaeon]
MLGDLVYEGKARITHARVLDTEKNKIEYNINSEGKFKDIDTTFLGTFWTVSVDDNVVYGEGQHVITTKDGGETATFNGYGIGRSKGQSGSSFRGSNFYKTSSNGKLAFLNNTVGVFETEVDESGIGVVKIWEWK